ncbi:MAG TPA: peroxiredoxin [Polyangiaceae bacterium]
MTATKSTTRIEKLGSKSLVRTPASAKRTKSAAPPENAKRHATGVASGSTPEHRLDVGDELPVATLPDQRGEPFAIASLRGKRAVVYFYPKDDTPGCTREACSFQEGLAKFKRARATLVGISPDPPRRHAQFAEKYQLTFTLLADTDRNYAKSCGVLVPKTLYGRTSIGIERTTFLVDEKGVIRRVWRKVKVDGHFDAVLAAL